MRLRTSDWEASVKAQAYRPQPRARSLRTQPPRCLQEDKMATKGKIKFCTSHKIKQVGRTDLPGGGLVAVENGYAYVGHMDPPYGPSIVDVRDPKPPKLVSQLEVPEGIHSHKVRVRSEEHTSELQSQSNHVCRL